VSKRNATLVHNEKAGDKRHDRAALVQLLERGDYSVSYFAAKECDLAEALGQPAEIIVSAGGDGMVARVAAHARSDGLRSRSCGSALPTTSPTRSGLRVLSTISLAVGRVLGPDPTTR